MKARTIAKSTVLSAFEHNQVIADEAELRVGKKQKIPCFRDSTDIEVRCVRRGPEIWLVNNGSEIGPITEGMVFRLAPEKTVIIPRVDYARASTTDRVRFYLRNYGALRGTVRMLRIALYATRRRESRPPLAADLLDKEGVTFRVERVGSKDVLIRCEERGAIYDFFINGEKHRLPPQVPGNYYATAYFACDAAMLANDHPEMHEAARLALGCAQRHFQDYPFARLLFQHTDFMFAPIREAARELRVDANIPNIEAMYDPVNVYALRTLNCVLSGEEGLALRHIQFVSQHQTADGMICDDYQPHYRQSRDLSYHQFAAACLSRAYMEGSDIVKEAVLPIIQRAAGFSESMLLSDGEASYYGRGNNNIYHLASAAYLFSVLWNLTAEARFLDAAHRTIHYLSTAGDGWMPSAINAHGDSLMGWNHCEMPYNMQTSYFLLHADSLLGDGNSAHPRSPTSIHLSDSGFFRFRNSLYDVCIAAGGEQLTWANGRHATGVAGIAALVVDGKQTALALDMLDNTVPITDLPRVRWRGGFMPPHEWSLTSAPGGCVLRTKRNGVSLTKSYTFKEDEIVCQIYFESKRPVDLQGLAALALMDDADVDVTVTVTGMNDDKQRVHVPSNTRGPGQIHLCGIGRCTQASATQTLRFTRKGI